MTTTNCPSCGAEVQFRYGSSIVVVCSHCGSAVARTDRGVEDLGKVAALIDSGSPLRIGLQGKFHDHDFVISGHVQLQHAMGGIWDEWYAAFNDGRWGWLAEAQGQFYLTFQKSAPPDMPPYASLKPGARLTGTLSELVVDEVGEAAARAAEGEIPWRVAPNYRYDYADLSGTNEHFATLDYSEEPPLLFAGKRVTLDETGLAGEQERVTHVKAVSVSCPHCGAPLELRMPDHTERLTCSHCGSLLDVNEGKLVFLRVLHEEPITPKIPLGTSGTIGTSSNVVTGFLRRSTVVDGETYFWDEYLLYDPHIGFRWLVDSDDHWTFAEAVAAGAVDTSKKGQLTVNGERFRIFQSGDAVVTYVLGEFYWKVSIGERVKTADYVSPPRMLSRELAQSQGSEEIDYSLGTYMTADEVGKAFGVKDLPRPSTVAPNQPNPYSLKIFRDFVIFVAVALILAIAFFALGERRVLLDRSFDLEPLAAGEQSKVFFTEPFTINAHHNLEVDASSNIDNNWINVDADLINEQSSVTEQFEVPVEYYHGTDDGESWSEGANHKEIYLAAVPGGAYTMRIDVQWEGTQPPSSSLHIRLREGVPHFSHFGIVVALLLLFPFLALIQKGRFESRRWSDAMFNPAGTPKPGQSSGSESSQEE
jgi:ribosomal protein S27AE